ncbi:MAG: VOC family protein [Gemmatimonadaceae bacterium]
MTSNPPISNGAAAHAQSEPFDATALAASLTVNSLPTSLAWYRDVLGFTVARVFDRGGVPFAASLRAGIVALLLTQDDGARGEGRIKGDGISLQLTTRQNIDELAQRFQARGGTIESGPMDVMGARVFRLRDPDGFKIVISTER